VATWLEEFLAHLLAQISKGFDRAGEGQVGVDPPSFTVHQCVVHDEGRGAHRRATVGVNPEGLDRSVGELDDEGVRTDATAIADFTEPIADARRTGHSGFRQLDLRGLAAPPLGAIGADDLVGVTDVAATLRGYQPLPADVGEHPADGATVLLYHHRLGQLVAAIQRASFLQPCGPRPHGRLQRFRAEALGQRVPTLQQPSDHGPDGCLHVLRSVDADHEVTPASVGLQPDREVVHHRCFSALSDSEDRGSGHDAEAVPSRRVPHGQLGVGSHAHVRLEQGASQLRDVVGHEGGQQHRTAREVYAIHGRPTLSQAAERITEAQLRRRPLDLHQPGGEPQRTVVLLERTGQQGSRHHRGVRPVRPAHRHPCQVGVEPRVHNRELCRVVDECVAEGQSPRVHPEFTSDLIDILDLQALHGSLQCVVRVYNSLTRMVEGTFVS